VSGNNFLLDTNIIVYAMKGLAHVRPFFENGPHISVITEMETAIQFCTIITLTNKIKTKR
jgi:hypothetical protein